MIIAFFGLAGSGKTTAAQYLVLGHSFKRIRFAGPLKNMIEALGLTREQIDGSEREVPCDLLGGKTPRWAMQTLGTEWGRKLIAEDLWIRAWRAAVEATDQNVVVDDCRFPNEVEAIRELGGFLVRIVRPGAGTESVHESEMHQEKFQAQDVIYNTRDITNLYRQVDEVLQRGGIR